MSTTSHANAEAVEQAADHPLGPFSIVDNGDDTTVADAPADPLPLTDPLASEPLYPQCITGILGAMGTRANPTVPGRGVRDATIVLSHGAGHLGRALSGSTVVTSNSKLAAFENRRPLATLHSQRRALHDGSFHALSQGHPIGHGIWHAGYPDLTKFPSGSASRIIIEQAHCDLNLEVSVRELSRVGVKGANFLLVGYQRFYVPAAPHLNEWLSSRWDPGLAKFLTKGERHLDEGFRNLVIPNSSEAFKGTGYTSGPQYLSKKLNLVELITTHLDTWPVVRRLVCAPTSAWFDVMRLRQEISDLWGDHPRTRKEVRWKPICRWGVVI